MGEIQAYVSRRFRDALLGLAADHFQLRTCAPLPRQVCLRYHLGACGGVCEHKVSVQDYAAAVAAAVALLARQTDLLRHLRRQMLAYAERLEFERAQRLKSHLEALEHALEPQVVERDVRHDQDVLYFGAERVAVMHVGRGAVQGLEVRALDSPVTRGAAAERCDRFLLGHYAQRSPQELIVNLIGDRAGVEQALTTANGSRVRITVPQRTGAAALLKRCELNHAYRVADAPEGPCASPVRPPGSQRPERQQRVAQRERLAASFRGG